MRSRSTGRARWGCAALVVSSLAIAAACSRPNPDYCERPEDCDGLPCDLATSSCCDPATMTCPQCGPGAAAQCSGTTPVCLEDYTCRGCAADGECASEACLPDGACADPASVLYAAPAETDTTPCSLADPCSFAGALALVTAEKSVVKLAAGQYDLASVAVNADVTITGRGAILDRTAPGDGPVLSIAAGRQVEISFVTIQGGDGPNGHGIACLSDGTVGVFGATVTGNAGAGIAGASCAVRLDQSTVSANLGSGVLGSGTLTVSRSTVSANTSGGVHSQGGDLTVSESTVSANLGGLVVPGRGIAATGGTAVVSQSFVAGNEDAGVSASGTLEVSRTTVSGNNGIGIFSTGPALTVSRSAVSFNVGSAIVAYGGSFSITNNFIVGNGMVTTPNGAIDLIASTPGTYVLAFNTIVNNQSDDASPAGIRCTTVTIPLTFSSNVIFNNFSPQQVGGANCSHIYSNIQQAVPGAGNINQAPSFTNAPAGDFHLEPGSAGLGMADPAATLSIDFDGEPRPQPSPGRADMGADEIP